MKSSLLWSTSPTSLSSISPFVLLLAGCLSGCGSGTSIVTEPVTISISPSPAFVASAGQRQFTATVTNTSNTAVTWQVNGVTGGNASVGTISSSGLYIAPSSGTGITVTVVSQADSTKSASTTVSILAPHTIAVRPTSSGVAEFYDVATGNTFTPRGNSYVRLAWQTSPTGQVYYHSTFNVGVYDAPRAETALAEMQSYGYNIVRVWLNGCCTNTIGNPAGGSLQRTSPTSSTSWPGPPVIRSKLS